jgi:hypothetical protein
MSTDNWLTQKEAAQLTGVSVDTIQRRRKDGRLGACRQHPLSGAWLVPLSGLIDADLYTPTDEDPREVLDQGRTARDLAEAVKALEVEQVRSEQLQLRIDELTRQNDQLLKLLRPTRDARRAA